MSKILFASDLDNTLIHSLNHRREGDICVEMLRGQQQGFMSAYAYELLHKVCKKVDFVPVTTRSVEQFRRIELPVYPIEKAITTNGAILIEKDQINETVREKSLAYAASFMDELEAIRQELENRADINVCRIVDGAYLYISAKDRAAAEVYLSAYEKNERLNVVLSGRKVYFLPPEFTKGSALQQLKDRCGYEKLIAAGDSTIDLSMLNIADYAIVPRELESSVNGPGAYVFGGDGDFADFVLDTVLSII